MELAKKLRECLGRPESTNEADILAAIAPAQAANRVAELDVQKSGNQIRQAAGSRL